jgi:hypothetical protein
MSDAEVEVVTRAVEAMGVSKAKLKALTKDRRAAWRASGRGGSRSTVLQQLAMFMRAGGASGLKAWRSLMLHSARWFVLQKVITSMRHDAWF